MALGTICAYFASTTDNLALARTLAQDALLLRAAARFALNFLGKDSPVQR